MKPLQEWSTLIQNDAHKIHFHLPINQKDFLLCVPTLSIGNIK